MSQAYDDWQLLCRDFSSPEVYIEAGFYFMIGAALQRRVWYGSLDHSAVFPNNYFFFVAEPGAGKGEVTGLLKRILSKHKRKRSVEEELAETISGDVPTSGRELFTLGGDSTTYESLTQETARSSSHIRVPRSAEIPSGVYTHASIAFILDELPSLFCRHSENIITFLLTAYNCENTPYKRSTKNQGKDTIVNACTNLLGGIQPDKFAEIAAGLIPNGLLSRTILIYAARNRLPKMFREPMDKEQREALKRLEDYVLELSKVCGPLDYSPEAKDFLKWWGENPNWEKDSVINRSPKLIHYYSRKRIHVQKMAMAVMFSKEPHMRAIDANSCHDAIELLEKWERDAHKCFGAGGRNDLALTIKNMMTMLSAEELTMNDLFLEFTNDFKSRAELIGVMDDLCASGRVECIRNGSVELKYKAKRRV